jgi:hypothetical protein
MKPIGNCLVCKKEGSVVKNTWQATVHDPNLIPIGPGSKDYYYDESEIHCENCGIMYKFFKEEKELKEEKTTIHLTDYHVANLRAAIEAAGYPGGAVPNPIPGLNTGDWLGEIYLMLPPVNCQPNISSVQMANSSHKMNERIQHRCSVSGNPSGTDTWRVGWTCPCAGCVAYLREHSAEIPREPMKLSPDGISEETAKELESFMNDLCQEKKKEDEPQLSGFGEVATVHCSACKFPLSGHRGEPVSYAPRGAWVFEPCQMCRVIEERDASAAKIKKLLEAIYGLGHVCTMRDEVRPWSQLLCSQCHTDYSGNDSTDDAARVVTVACIERDKDRNCIAEKDAEIAKLTAKIEQLQQYVAAILR